jgi:nicotinate phosphoribosyltransferase
VQAHADETAAFESFLRTHAGAAMLLIDTYDTVAAARAVVAAGLRPPMVRLDSGDLDALSREVRAILDAGGLQSTRIFATSDLDEYRVRELLDAGAPIDGFGIGTALTTVSDAPALPAVYKVTEVERDGARVDVAKRSPGKHTWPGRKQIWRVMEEGRMRRDVIAAADEPRPANGEPLLIPVMANGRRIAPPEPLGAMRERCRTAMAMLPDEFKSLERLATYEVAVSDALERRRREGSRS